MSEEKKLNLDEAKNLHGGYWRYDILDFHYLYNHYFPTKELIAKLQEKLPTIIDTYPSTQRIIAKLLSKWKDEDYFNENNLIVSNGSSELIRILNQIMTKVTVPIPTFNEYVQLPKEKMNLFIMEEKNKFKIDIDELIKSIEKSKSEFVAINNPNNPVGNVLTRKEIEELLQTGVNVVVDQAFIDFCREHSVEDLVAKYENLIVIMSCSKTMGFAGLRLGYLLSTNEEIKNKIKKLSPIWNINSLAETLIELFVDFKKDYEYSLERITEDREELFENLKTISFLEPYPSNANFIFCKTTVSSRKLAEILFNKYNILIRYSLNQDTLKSDEYIRIAVKKKQEHDKLISALKEIEKEVSHS